MTNDQIIQAIDEYKASQDYKDIMQAEKYYVSKSKIKDRSFSYYYNNSLKNDPYRANNKIANNFFKMIVDQKVSYCVGKDITFEDYMPILDINEFIDEVAEEASIKKKAWVYIYINEFSELSYKIIPTEEIIAFYDDMEELSFIIRFYEKNKKYVETYDKDVKSTYMLDGTDLILLNSTPYILKVNDKSKDNKGIGFGRIPFICLNNNKKNLNDLGIIKDLIDIYDICLSDFANNFEDFQDIIIKLKNYKGDLSDEASISNVLELIKKYGIANVDEDGDIEFLTKEVPYAARKEFLETIRKNIYLFSQAVDTDTLTGSNLTNIVIKSKFESLDQKANKFIKQLKRFIKEIMLFENIYRKIKNLGKEYDLNKVKIIFNKRLLINESELIDNLVKSVGMLSQETRTMLNPYSTDDEYDKLKEETNKDENSGSEEEEQTENQDKL